MSFYDGSTQFGSMVQAPEQLTQSNVSGPAVLKAWRNSTLRLQRSRERILDVREFRSGGLEIPLPPSVGDQYAYCRIKSVERFLAEPHLKNTLSANEPAIERVAQGTTDQADKDADQLELYAETVKQQILPWDAFIGKQVEDGEVGVVLLPDVEHYFNVPDVYDYLNYAQYKMLDGVAKDGYTLFQTDGEPSSKENDIYRRRKPRYAIDAEGRMPGEAGYTKPSQDRLGKILDRDIKTRMAQRVPLTCRLIPALDCAPYLIRGRGRQKWECAGLIERALFEKEYLIQQGYSWHGMNKLVIPHGYDETQNGRPYANDYGTRGMLYLYTLYAMLPNPETMIREPCIVYVVGGQNTWGTTDAGPNQTPVLINLREKYGFTKLPVNYFWGEHTEDDDPDWIGRPSLWATMLILLGKEELLTTYLAHARRYAWSKYATVPDPKIPPSAYLDADGVLRQFTIDDDKDIITLPGPTAPLQPPPVGAGVKELLGELSVQAAQDTPAPSTQGGAGASSGHEAVVLHDYQREAKGQILKEALRFVQWTTETAIEQLDMLGQRSKTRIPVLVEQEIPEDGETETKTVQTILELNPRWVAGNYSLKVAYPDTGNLAEIQQAADLVAQGFGSDEDVYRKQGKRSIITERVKAAAYRYWRSPAGEQRLQEAAAKRRGDIAQQQAEQLQQMGALTSQGAPGFPDGVPAAALTRPGASALGPGGPVPQASGMTQVPNVARAALAGTVGGQMGTSALLHDSRVLATSSRPAQGVS